MPARVANRRRGRHVGRYAAFAVAYPHILEEATLLDLVPSVGQLAGPQWHRGISGRPFPVRGSEGRLSSAAPHLQQAIAGVDLAQLDEGVVKLLGTSRPSGNERSGAW